MFSYREAAASLKPGDRVKLRCDVDVFPAAVVRAGQTGVVVENGLNEMNPILTVRMDEHIPALADWDNQLHLYGPDRPDSPDWDDGMIEVLPVKERFGIWCQRSAASIFGAASAWLKVNDVVWLVDSEAEAQAEAKRQNSLGMANVHYSAQRHS